LAVASVILIFINLCPGKSAKGKIEVKQIFEIKPDGGFFAADILTINTRGRAQIIPQ